MNFDRYRRKPVIWIVIIGALLVYVWFEGSLFGDIDKGGVQPGVNPAIAAATIGGPFELVDHTGQTVTDQSYAGKHLLVFFGYTWCPDICPTELLILGQAIDALGDDGEQVVPLFITIDPERDTPETLAPYVANFHPRMIGLTGSSEQVAAAAKAYRVYYRRSPQEPGTLHEEEEDDYLMDHSVYMYLMSPDGVFLQHFVRGQGPEKIAEVVKSHL